MDKFYNYDYDKSFFKEIGEGIYKIIIVIICIILISVALYWENLKYKAIKNIAHMNTNTIEQEEQNQYYCPECGNDVSANDKFCSKCGTKFNN